MMKEKHCLFEKTRCYICMVSSNSYSTVIYCQHVQIIIVRIKTKLPFKYHKNKTVNLNIENKILRKRRTCYCKDRVYAKHMIHYQCIKPLLIPSLKKKHITCQCVYYHKNVFFEKPFKN